METKNLIGGLLAATAIGIAVGILLAPGSGEQTRSKIAKGSRQLTDDLKSTMADGLDSLKSQFSRGVQETSKRVKDSLVYTEGVES